MKTIKQIADELGVSKQKVYRFIVRNHITASSEVKQSKLYDEATEMLIKQGILEDEPYQKSHHEAHQNHINDTVSEAVIELLRKELEQKNEQLQEKDRLSFRLGGFSAISRPVFSADCFPLVCPLCFSILRLDVQYHE